MQKETNKKELEAEVKQNLEKEQKKRQNRQLKIVLIGIISIFFLIAIFYFVVDSIRHFTYQGAEFEVVKEGDLIFYQNVLPVYSPTTGAHIINYNTFLRTDPRKLKNIPFEGNLLVLQNIVINSTQNFDCEGKQIVAIANLNNFYKGPVFNANVFKNDSLGCSETGDYTFIRLQKGKNSGIEQFGPSCYNFNIKKDCDIVPVTEKFLVETISELS